MFRWLKLWYFYGSNCCVTPHFSEYDILLHFVSLALILAWFRWAGQSCVPALRQYDAQVSVWEKQEGLCFE